MRPLLVTAAVVGFAALAFTVIPALEDPSPARARAAAVVSRPTAERPERPWSATGEALAWLARAQGPDGSWEPGILSGDWGAPAVTGLAVLAFLGSGHSERHGHRKAVVAKAVRWLRQRQDAEGRITRPSGRASAIDHAVAGLALAEAYAMARVETTGDSARRAVDYSVDVLQTPGSGWGDGPGARPDLASTVWFVMQMKSAVVAGITVPAKGFKGAVAFVDSVTVDPAGEGYYAGLASDRPGEPPTPEATAMAALCRQFMGWKRSDPVLAGAARVLLDDIAERERSRARIDPLYRYIGKLVAFQTGSDLYKVWSRATNDKLMSEQTRTGPGRGSWRAERWLPSRGGSVRETALAACCLSIYCRGYMPFWSP